MKMLFYCFTVLSLLLSACAPAGQKAQMSVLWNKYNSHCMEHARTVTQAGSPDEETHYRECMDYFIKANIECPYCVVKK